MIKLFTEEILNYRPIFEFLKIFAPCACLICNQRQKDVICLHCQTSLFREISSKKCVICANPHHAWVCKRCSVAHWAFDATHSLSSEHSRLVPLMKKFHLHGNLKQSKGIFLAWEKMVSKEFSPVDLLIPMPEPLSATQLRGYQSNLEMTKLLSRSRNIPYLTALLDSYPEASMLAPNQSPFQIELNPSLVHSIAHLRIGVVGNLMESEYIYHHFAKALKSLGALWVSNWIMIRVPNKKTQTCSILS
ncbi:Predicted amidophosphoribosyltransferases [Polynucleobacter kasalickyi]|uniref:Predicted amidophosphoribosyltransferases n=2 Tax=Polynucleobacter kasalickyi TaxID=1938817 RepID=A0A1W2ARH0_9BURK|nr:Predicted amidophosphoribosyltransferases [Polynucleobacter kasalickyi]